MRNVLFGEWNLHPSVWGLWILLTTAALGFAVLLAGFNAESKVLQQIGLATLATGAVCFLFVQFWITTTREDGRMSARGFSHAKATPRAGPMPDQASPVNFDYPAPAADGPSTHTRGGLVVFESVPTVEARPESTPMEKASQVLLETARPNPAPMDGWPLAPEEPPREAVPDYHAATLERRNAYIKDLPIVEEILKAPSPGTGRPTRTLGKCGGCGTKLWAPSTRPIRLRCPRCGRSSTLQ